jgi:2,5-dihydroxypyridine 5,6-dioxygenase
MLMRSESETPAQLVSLFRREFELCGVQRGETVGILTENRARSDYAAAFEAAAADHGASAFTIDVPAPMLSDLEGLALPQLDALASTPVVTEALGRCDLVVDLLHMLWSEQQQQIRRAGARILLCHEPVSVLARLFPTQDQRLRVERAAEMLAGAKTMRVTSRAGTDITYEVGQYGRLVQYGSTDEPGRWDHFPSTFVATVANDGAASGVVVLSPRDLVLPFTRYISEPVRIRVEKARVVSIEGGHDAALLRQYMHAFDDERGYALSHIGWGLNERANWNALELGSGGVGMDNRSMLGSVMFALGPNTELGGDNDTACHIDIPMLDCSLELDGTRIIDGGAVLTRDLLPYGGQHSLASS